MLKNRMLRSKTGNGPGDEATGTSLMGDKVELTVVNSYMYVHMYNNILLAVSLRASHYSGTSLFRTLLGQPEVS